MLDEQGLALRRLVRNTGEVFGAINERQGALRELIVNSKRTFEATAARDEALAETIEIFPTFLDESRATAARLEDFARDTHPLVNDLKGPADDLGADAARPRRPRRPISSACSPTSIRSCAPGAAGVPALERTLREAEPLAEGLHAFFPELNPILVLLQLPPADDRRLHLERASDLAADYGTGQRGQTQIGIIEGRSLQGSRTGRSRPTGRAGNAYLAPNALKRALTLGGIESFDCPGGERRDPEDATEPGEMNADKRAPCLIAAAVAIRRRAASPIRARARRRCARRRRATPDPRRRPTRVPQTKCR